MRAGQGLGMGRRLGRRVGPSVSKRGCLAKGAGSQPGLRRAWHSSAWSRSRRRGQPVPAGRRRPEAGRSHRTATRMEIRWELRLGHKYYLACLGRGAWSRRSARVGCMAASSAHSGRTSDCGGTVVGIVYVCAALVFHSRCKRGLPRRIRLSVHGVKGLNCCCTDVWNLVRRGPCGRRDRGG